MHLNTQQASTPSQRSFIVPPSNVKGLHKHANSICGAVLQQATSGKDYFESIKMQNIERKKNSFHTKTRSFGDGVHAQAQFF